MMKIEYFIGLVLVFSIFSCGKEEVKPKIDYCLGGYVANFDSTACVCPPETHWEFEVQKRCYKKSYDLFIFSTDNIPCLVPDRSVSIYAFDESEALMTIIDTSLQQYIAFSDLFRTTEHELLKNEVNENGERVIEAKLGGILGWPAWLDCEIFREQFGDRFKHVEASMKSIRTADNNKKIDFQVIYRIKNVDSTFTTLDTGYIYAVKPW